MSTRVGSHIRSNIIGYVALFFAIGGTAYATHPGGANSISTGDIINDQVFTQDLADNNLTSLDIRNDNLGSGGLQAIDLRDDSVGTSEIVAQAVGSSELSGTGFGNNGFNGDEEIIDGSITGFDIGANQLGGGHIADGSLGGADIADDSVTGADISTTYSAAESAADTTFCNDDDANGEVCATLNITLAETQRVMLTATGDWHTHGASGATSCLLDHDGIETVGAPQNIGEAGSNHPLGADESFALTGISAPIGAGTHAMSLVCTQTDPDGDVGNVNLTAVTVDE